MRLAEISNHNHLQKPNDYLKFDLKGNMQLYKLRIFYPHISAAS